MSLRRPAHDTDGSPDAKPRAAPAPRQRTPLPPALPPQRFWNPFTWIQGVRDLCAICVLALQLLVPNIAVIAAAQAARWTVEAWVTPTVVAPAVRAAVTKTIDSLLPEYQKTYAWDMCVPSSMTQGGPEIEWADQWPACKGIIKDFLFSGSTSMSAYLAKSLTPLLAVVLLNAWASAAARAAVGLHVVRDGPASRGAGARAARAAGLAAALPAAAWRGARAALLLPFVAVGLFMLTFFCFLLPMPWTLPLHVSMQLAVEAAIFEGVGAFAALRRSREAMAGYESSSAIAYVAAYLTAGALSWQVAPPALPTAAAPLLARAVAAARGTAGDMLTLAAYVHFKERQAAESA